MDMTNASRDDDEMRPEYDFSEDLLQDIDLRGGHTDFIICDRNSDELPPELRRAIELQFDTACDLMDAGLFTEALRTYRMCLQLLPQPRASWVAHVKFLCGMGDALWFLRKHAEGLPLWGAALLGGGLGNPFAHLRRGQTLYELGRHDAAANELLRALLLGGSDIFADEPPEYWEFITSRVRTPAGRSSWHGWRGVAEGSEMHERLLDMANYEMRWAPKD
jgi:tetratricopeptide (TPR) repeat protein